MKKKTIRIKEIGENLPSKITLKQKGENLDEVRVLEIRNDGGNWTHPNEMRIKVKLRDSANTTGKPEVSIKLRDGSKAQMSFLDLCDLRDILTHEKDLGLNLFNKTEVDKK
jgi:hypothetical protein